MKASVYHEFYGEIVYFENVWTGKTEIMIGGMALEKVGKKSYLLPTPEGKIPVGIRGNMLTSVQLTIGTVTVTVVDKPTWYEYVLAILPFVSVMIWSSSVTLCSIIPVIGGVIGGAICGAFMIVSLVSMKKCRNTVNRILVGLGVVVAAFAVCAILGYIYVAILVSLQ